MPYPVTSAMSANNITLVMTIPYNDWIMYACTGQLLPLASEGIWEENTYNTQEAIENAMLRSWDSIQFMQILTGQIIAYPLDNMEWINRTPGGEPSGLLPCDGAQYSVVSYPNLYALIGNTWGGDSTVFNVPDLRGRVLNNADDMGTSQGAAGVLTPSWASTPAGVGGEQDHTLIVNELASHDHTTAPHTHVVDPHDHSTIPHSHAEGIAVPSLAEAPIAPIPSAIPGVGSTLPSGVTVLPNFESVHDASVSVGATGGDQAHNNVQPSATVFWYIVAF